MTTPKEERPAKLASESVTAATSPDEALAAAATPRLAISPSTPDAPASEAPEGAVAPPAAASSLPIDAPASPTSMSAVAAGARVDEAETESSDPVQASAEAEDEPQAEAVAGGGTLARFMSPGFLLGFGLGVFAGVALALLAVVLVRGDNTSSQTTFGQLPTEVPAVADLPATPTPDARPRVRNTLSVHLGPGTSYAILGTLASGNVVDVLGRDSTAGWVTISFPPGSAGRGWVQVSGLEGLDDAARLAVVGPTPLAYSTPSPARATAAVASGDDRSESSAGNFDFPTSTPATTTGSPRPSASRATPTPAQAQAEASPSAAGTLDLAIEGVSVLSDGRVSVTVGNRGSAALSGQSVFVVVRDLGIRSETLISQQRGLAAGASITLQTQSFRVDEAAVVQAIVDPFTTLPDINRRNNTFSGTLTPPLSATPAAGE
jgi:hypothetical protein